MNMRAECNCVNDGDCTGPVDPEGKGHCLNYSPRHTAPPVMRDYAAERRQKYYRLREELRPQCNGRLGDVIMMLIIAVMLVCFFIGVRNAFKPIEPQGVRQGAAASEMLRICSPAGQDGKE